MSHMPSHHAENRQNQYGLKVASRLSGAVSDLPYEVSERLRASRVRAIASRKKVAAPAANAVVYGGGAAAMLLGDEGGSWWHRILASVPLVILVMGLVSINMLQNESRVAEVAEIDSAILTDVLPLSAYVDPGFVHFLKSNQDQAL